MEHTYLRYECADSFGLAIATASSKAPPSNSVLAFIGNSRRSNNNSTSTLLTTTASCITGFNLKSCQQTLKLGHREHLTGGVGTGRALNSDEVVCLDVSASTDVSSSVRVATGWIDGSVRVFDVEPEDLQKTSGLAHSLLQDNEEGEDFLLREPLVLNGHNQSPVRSIAFDKGNVSRLASGGSDGSVVLWDVVAETGLFRLLGHRGGITDIMFANLPGLDALISTSLDGLVKVWDLTVQCCTQTIARHQGEVLGAACMPIKTDPDEEKRWRMITGGRDGQIRVWSVQPPKRSSALNENDAVEPGTTGSDEKKLADQADQDDVCHFMGKLLPPPNVATSAEKVACVHYHSSGRYVGILYSNSRNIDVYLIRSTKESSKKRQRRLRRRQEKKTKLVNSEKLQIVGRKGQKRGILDDPESSNEDEDLDGGQQEKVDPELIKASDEFEYITTVRASHKIRSFIFVPKKEKGELVRVVSALSTNALQTHSLIRKKDGTEGVGAVVVEIVSTLEEHPTGIRAVVLSSDDRLACTVSKSVTKIWNVASRRCIQSLSPALISSNSKGKGACYGLCTIFLPGNTHVVVGTREGHLLVIDISAGDIVYCEEQAHDGAIWDLDIRCSSPGDSSISLVTGSADKTLKFWDIEAQGDEEDDVEHPGSPMLVHARTLQMTDDVVAVRYSHSLEASKRLVFVSTLDCTVKVFFDDSLKLFLNLYGHKLPALAVDASDDDALLATGGADKTVKIWGLDFGDTHRTMHGHEDSITDIRFVRRTHNFFTSSKDGTVRYWDGDRFEQILLLSGHTAEVNCLAVSRTGAFALSGGMDRQVRVWERTKDIVFLEEERERALEKMFDKVSNRDEGGTGDILGRKGDGIDLDDAESGDENLGGVDEPQSEAAVKKSVMSVSSGDRIMEALELADQELKEIALFRKNHGVAKARPQNPLLLGKEPAPYVLWVLKSVKSAELEQSLLILPLSHLERLMYYLTVLLKSNRGVELCSRVAVFMVKAHQNQIVANRSLIAPLRELRRLIRLRLLEVRDIVGYDLAALKVIAQVANDRKQSYENEGQSEVKDIWAGLGFGSDVAAALESRSKKR